MDEENWVPHGIHFEEGQPRRGLWNWAEKRVERGVASDPRSRICDRPIKLSLVFPALVQLDTTMHTSSYFPKGVMPVRYLAHV